MSAPINSDVTLMTEHLTYRPAVSLDQFNCYLSYGQQLTYPPLGPDRRHSKQHQHPRLQSNRSRRARPPRSKPFRHRL